jgi:hypothetical protein
MHLVIGWVKAVGRGLATFDGEIAVELEHGVVRRH